MFISIDAHGRVVINSITKILFVLKASKHVIIDPSKYTGSPFTSVSPRFKSLHGQGLYDDLPLVALSNPDVVYIVEVRPNSHSEVFKITKPDRFYNPITKSFEEIGPCPPSTSWGFGMSPLLRDRPHSLLAVAWGPLIQLVVLIDHENSANPFVRDGFYILKTVASEGSPLRKSVKFSAAVQLSSI